MSAGNAAADPRLWAALFYSGVVIGAVLQGAAIWFAVKLRDRRRSR